MNREVHAPFAEPRRPDPPGRPDYAFDAWMARMFPTIPFERYVDDVVMICVSERLWADSASRSIRLDEFGE